MIGVGGWVEGMTGGEGDERVDELRKKRKTNRVMPSADWLPLNKLKGEKKEL